MTLNEAKKPSSPFGNLGDPPAGYALRGVLKADMTPEFGFSLMKYGLVWIAVFAYIFLPKQFSSLSAILIAIGMGWLLYDSRVQAGKSLEISFTPRGGQAIPISFPFATFTFRPLISKRGLYERVEMKGMPIIYRVGPVRPDDSYFPTWEIYAREDALDSKIVDMIRASNLSKWGYRA